MLRENIAAVAKRLGVDLGPLDAAPPATPPEDATATKTDAGQKLLEEGRSAMVLGMV